MRESVLEKLFEGKHFYKSYILKVVKKNYAQLSFLLYLGDRNFQFTCWNFLFYVGIEVIDQTWPKIILIWVRIVEKLDGLFFTSLNSYNQGLWFSKFTILICFLFV